MKTQLNPILQIVVSRVVQLLARYDESSAITHSATKGSLREGYLKQFLVDFIPPSLSVKSGFVSDSVGQEISPQIDLIVFDPTFIPAVALNDYVAILPIECVRLVVEVKSALKKHDIQQIVEQQTSLRKLRHSFTTSQRKYLCSVDSAGASQFVVAFDSECSVESLTEWFRLEPQLQVVCVIGKFGLVRDFPGDNIAVFKPDDHHREVLQLLSTIHTSLTSAQLEMREALRHKTPEGELDFSSDIGAYLTFDVPHKSEATDSQKSN